MANLPIRLFSKPKLSVGLAALGAAALLLPLLPGQPAPAETSFLLEGGTLVDGTGAPARRADLLVQNGRIAAIGDALSAPPGVRRINIAGHTVLPGLFDLHTHVASISTPGSDQDWGKNLKAYLLAGVTSLADFASYGEAFPAIREVTASGKWPSPRLAMASRITTPGGHGLELARGEIFTQEVFTAKEGKAAVERTLPYQPDAIKVFTDGWRYNTNPDMTSMEEGTLRAIVQAAHAAAKPVLTHTVTVDRGKVAARAGVDAIMHGLQDRLVDQETVDLLLRHKTAYGPTSAVYEPRPMQYLDPLLEQLLHPSAVNLIRARPSLAEPNPQRLRKFGVLQQNTKRLFDAGVPIVAGTDAGISGTHHGWATVHEVELLVQAGLPPVAAIAAATGNAAKVLRVQAQRGTLALGLEADLLVVAGAPHENIADLRQTRHVFLAGRQLDLAALRQALAAPGPSPLDAIPAPALLDDCDAANGRSRLDTLWVNSYEGGTELSRAIFQRVPREGKGGFAMQIQATMSQSTKPGVRLILPLRKGGLQPMDLSRYKGLVFEARGDGPYELFVSVRGEREPLRAAFTATGQWTRVKIPFSALSKQSAGPADAVQLGFAVYRPAGARAWFAVDNIALYR